ncbi:MAG: 2OG-Fe(II) oxygenase family protein [Pseudomonadota bacterium]
MSIPIIDCDPSVRTELEIAKDIDRALSDIGFMAVENLGVSGPAVEAMFAASAGFFAGSSADKQRCAYGAASENFGYQGLLAEALDPDKPGDLKESFTMRNLRGAQICASRWPHTEFRNTVLEFYDLALAGARRLQRLLALALGTEELFFVDRHTGENVTLRLLHYPPVADTDVQALQMGAGAHTDYGMLTLLFQDGVGGLQVRSEDGNWHDVPARDGAIVINAGDLLEVWSNGRYRSTWHRVVPQSSHRNRHSIALFVDPDSETQVEALASCVSESHPARFAPTTAGAHLQAKIEATHTA